MRECSAVLPALLLILLKAAIAAENLNEAAAESARKAAAFAGTRDVVSISFRNLSSLAPGDAARARSAFEATLRELGAHLADTGTNGELRITVAENPSQYLLVVEGRRADDRQPERHVWISFWPRTASTVDAAGARLEQKLLWDQAEPILDAATPEDALLILSPSRLTIYHKPNGAWQPGQSLPIEPPRPWPRDLRGRLRLTGSTLRISLPGVLCSGAWQPSLEMQCKPSEEAWVLESGSQWMLLASFMPTRNFFDGRIITQSGARKSVPPFYSGAAVDDGTGPLWLLAGVDGRTQMYDSSFTPVGTAPGWGSDIAGTSGRCGAGQQVLATRPEEASEAVQAFSIVNRQAEPLSAPLPMSGPVTALWPDGTAALAVIKDATTGRYAAYRLTLACGS